MNEPSKSHDFSEEKEIKHSRCEHELYLVSATEMRCKKCTAGWMGREVVDIYKSSVANHQKL